MVKKSLTPDSSTHVKATALEANDGTGGPTGLTQANQRLEEMGYQQELTRNLSMVSILGLSFAIMAVPYGLSTTLNTALTNGGPVTVIWGWVVVSILSIMISLSLAEICSVYPTSGGVYYWSACVCTPKYAPVASYLTGWLGLVGNWTVTLSIVFGGAQLILAAITLWNDTYVPTPWQTVLCFWAALILATAFNVFFNRHLELLNTACIWWTGTSVIIIIVVLLVKCPDLHSAKYAFGHFDPTPSGWVPGWSFMVGLLQAAYTLTGYGMVAALCEEVHQPERAVPRAMVLSVIAAAITGVIYLIPINFVLPDIAPLLAVTSLQPIPLLFKEVTGSAAGGFGLLFLIFGIWAFASIGALTAASRCTWAFSRDGGIPFSQYWKVINPRFGIPLNALLLSSTVIGILGLIYLGSAAAFSAFTGTATICLGCSYGFPVACSLIRGRKMVKGAPFSLGRYGFFINAITVAWIAFSIVLFCMPTAIPVTPSTMNYAAAVFAGFSLIAALWYFLWAHKFYSGPSVSSVRIASGDVEAEHAVSDLPDGGRKLEQDMASAAM